MHPELEKVYTSIHDLSIAVFNMTTDDRTLNDMVNMSMPPLTRQDLANLAIDICDRIKEYDIELIDDPKILHIKVIPDRIEKFKAVSVPYIFSTTYQYNSMAAYIALINWISSTLDSLFSWQVIQDSKAIPYQLAKRIRTIQAELDQLTPNKDNLTQQIKLIEEATSAAGNLPADLQSLQEARTTVSQLTTDSTESYLKIKAYLKTSLEEFNTIKDARESVDEIAKHVAGTQGIVTSVALARAFQRRSTELRSTMWIWVLILVIALGSAVWIGALRFDKISSTIDQLVIKGKIDWGIVWMEISLSIFGIAAPIWLGWVATKQINQRFRLAEDYAFKASVAEAYEGYRREAASIDPILEARLFSSALLRLEEAPLRLVEADNHGSPWHELFSSKPFQQALQTFPELRDKFIDLAKHGIDGIKNINVFKKPNNTSSDPEKEE